MTNYGYNKETLASITKTNEIFEDVLEKNISANPDLPIEFIKDTLIAKELPKEPFSLELEE